MAQAEKISEIEPSWQEAAVISEKVDVQERFAANVIELLDDGATIPFIARYRRERTGDMPVEKLREVSSVLEDLRVVKTKIKNVYIAVKGQNKMTKQLEIALKHSRTVEEVEMLYAPYKPGHKGSLAERARAVGLEPAATSILEGRKVDFDQYVKPTEKGLTNVSEVKTGVQHIIADIIAKDKEVMDEIRRICATSKVKLQSERLKPKTTATKKKDGKDTVKVENGTPEKTKIKKETEDKSSKFEHYFDFSVLIKCAKPHMILAMNRGEEQKVLTIKVIMPDTVKLQFTQFVHKKFVKKTFPEACRTIIERAIEDSFSRLVQPQMCRQIRSEQTKAAEKASIAVFADNLRRLLLTPPVKGKTVLGIDPGFTNGCKSAVISPTGQILQTEVLYLHGFKFDKSYQQGRVVNLVQTHRCDVIAIGNGVGCRETEEFIADLIQKNAFGSHSVVYCIVDEGGASIYSVSDEAQKELPDLDHTLRGAVSIARRLQDPLSEFVKIEPKHLGIGMYQHDVSKTKLQTALDSVVEECVSFVGVDLNTASQCLLRRVAGLSAAKANKIIDWRGKNGRFVNRSQLLGIKGFGEKSFEQCAGFVRVVHDFSQEDVRAVCVKAEPETAAKPGQKRKAATKTKAGGAAKKAKLMSSDSVNPLDMTAIHPESYNTASRFVADLGLTLDAVGQESFISRVKKSVSAGKGVGALAEKYGVGVPTMQLIVDALSRALNYDFRSDFQKPLFKKGLTAITDLQEGSVLTGRVQNVTHFGAFVDIGVKISGLIHVSQMRPPLRPGENLGLGDHVEVKVLSVDVGKRRIGLQLKKVL